MTDIRIGQRFRVANSPYRVVWEVVGLMEFPGMPEQHARLRRPEDPAEVKTISVSTLRNPARYFPVD